MKGVSFIEWHNQFILCMYGKPLEKTPKLRNDELVTESSNLVGHYLFSFRKATGCPYVEVISTFHNPGLKAWGALSLCSIASAIATVPQMFDWYPPSTRKMRTRRGRNVSQRQKIAPTPQKPRLKVSRIL